MRHTSTIFSWFIMTVISCIGFSGYGQQTVKLKSVEKTQDTIKNRMVVADSLKKINLKLLFFKKKAHASYYADKFNGKRTASGKKFNNNNYTAAHRRFAFGTKLKVTNEANGKWVIVEITDRGPFIRGREIDLSKRAFKDIASNNSTGSAIVTIELIVE